MIAKAVLKYARRTPRKVNLVLETIRGRNVDYAFMLLKTLKKGSKEEVSKTLKSAVSNAYEKVSQILKKFMFRKHMQQRVQP